MADVKVEVEQSVQEVGKFARAVVAKRLAIIAVLTIILNLSVSNNWVPANFSDHTLSVVTSVLDALAAIAAVAVIHPVVTPLKDPRDNQGNALVAANTTVTTSGNVGDVSLSVNATPVTDDEATSDPDEPVEDVGDDTSMPAVVESNGMNVEPDDSDGIQHTGEGSVAVANNTLVNSDVAGIGSHPLPYPHN